MKPLIQLHQKTHIDLMKLNSKAGPLFEYLFPALEDEMRIVSKRFYQYEGNHPEDDLFHLIERSWVGILNNALVRGGKDVVTLQEFTVWDSKGKSAGRCDLLFSWGDLDVMVEAKSAEFKPKSWRKPSKGFYNKTFSKLSDVYFGSEAQYYNRTTFGIVLYFEWIRETGDLLNQAEQVMNVWDPLTDPDTHFLALYKGHRRGLFVYGYSELLKQAKA